MARTARAIVDTGTREADARASRDQLAAMGEVAKSFSEFRPRAEVIRNVEAVPTIFPYFNHSVGVGGLPISRFTLVHGPSNEGKTELCMGLISSFLKRQHFAGFVDAERTTTETWLKTLMGNLADHPGFSALPVGSYEQVRGGVRNWCETIANARVKGKLHPDTTGVLVVDSIRKLMPKKLWDELSKAVVADEAEAKPKARFGRKPKGGVDGIGGRAGQIKAAYNAAWVDELAPLLADTRTAMVIIARETEDADADPWSTKTWKIGGGSALFYEASLDIRVTRGWLKAGDTLIGEKHRLEIWKTKVANKLEKQPEAWFHTCNGASGITGFDYVRDLLAVGEAIGAIELAGAFYKIGRKTIGQGVEAAVGNLWKSQDLFREVEAAVEEASAKAREASVLL